MKKAVWQAAMGLAAAMVLLGAAGCGDGGGGKDADAETTDLAQEDAGDASPEGTDVPAEDGGGDPQPEPQDTVEVPDEDDGGQECPVMTCDCPDYATSGANMFCEGDNLYTCMLACMPDCGCSCVSEMVEHCEGEGGCIDNEDGNAACGD